MAEVTGLVIRHNMNPEKVTVEGVNKTLKNFYTLLGCDLVELIDIAECDNNMCITLVCDEEAILTNKPPVRNLYGFGLDYIIFGDFFVCRRNSRGALVSLKGQDINKLRQLFKL